MFLVVRFTGLFAVIGLLLEASPTFYPVVGSIAAACITAWVTYKVASRRSSGSINTTEAADLWQAADQIRKELRDEVVMLRARVRELEDRIDELEKPL